MKLVVGLGNTGKKYNNTRHNLGHWVVERLKKMRSHEFESKQIILAKNVGFMNESGEDVLRLVKKAGADLKNLLIIHDDFDVPLGEFKLQFGRSSAGHKGVQSVIDELGSKDFWRLRVGIGRPPAGVEADDFVISEFSPPEQEIIDDLFPSLLQAVEDWVLKK